MGVDRRHNAVTEDPMAKTIKLTDEQKATKKTILSRMQDAKTDLEGLIEELRAEYEERDASWQETQAGSDADSWIQEFDDVSSNLDELVSTLDGIEDHS